jgi:hypothetical protein
MGGIHAREECAVLCMLSCLMRCAGNDGFSAVVDIFNVTAGTWRTAKLSQARMYLAATSLPNVGVAMFAGGYLSTWYDKALPIMSHASRRYLLRSC